jgi:hypothetical protein
MTDADLEEYLRGLDLTVEAAQDSGNNTYIVVRNITIPTGPLASRTCDVAIARCGTVPYVVPPAIHTRPALVPMAPGPPLATQGSPLGSEWQYWSRRFDRPPTPQTIWAHVLTIFGQVAA